MSRRSISLVWELEELEQAVDAARVLCDASSQNQYATEYDARIAPRVTSAVLTLVGQRLGLLRRVIHSGAPVKHWPAATIWLRASNVTSMAGTFFS
ncbi:MAG: hypothetical protein ACM3ZE_14745, partial [Myxococcales bacterium]